MRIPQIQSLFYYLASTVILHPHPTPNTLAHLNVFPSQETKNKHSHHHLLLRHNVPHAHHPPAPTLSRISPNPIPRISQVPDTLPPPSHARTRPFDKPALPPHLHERYLTYPRKTHPSGTHDTCTPNTQVQVPSLAPPSPLRPQRAKRRVSMCHIRSSETGSSCETGVQIADLDGTCCGVWVCVCGYGCDGDGMSCRGRVHAWHGEKKVIPWTWCGEASRE